MRCSSGHHGIGLYDVRIQRIPRPCRFIFTAIDPQLKVTPSQGKTMAADDPKLTALKAYPGIKIYTETLEDHALVICGEHQAMVTIKGVDDNFARMADLNKLLYGDGTFTLHADVLEFGVLGIQLAAQLGLGASFDTPLKVYAPQRESG